MGDDLSTGTKIGIGLAILYSLIVIVLSLPMVIKNVTNSGANQLESDLGQMMTATYDDHDQKTVTGAKITSAIRLFSGEPADIAVVTGLCQNTGTNNDYRYDALLKGYQQEGQNSNYSYKSSTALARSTGDTSFTVPPVTPVTYNLNTRPMTVSGNARYARDNGKYPTEFIEDGTGTIISISFTQQAT